MKKSQKRARERQLQRAKQQREIKSAQRAHQDRLREHRTRQEADQEMKWARAMADHEETILDVLRSLPRDILSIRSTPQYTFMCKRCGCFRAFHCREDMYAFKEMHRPKVEGQGRAYNCQLLPVTKLNRKGRIVTTLTIPENMNPVSREEMGLGLSVFEHLYQRIERQREEVNEREEDRATDIGVSEASPEDRGAGVATSQ